MPVGLPILGLVAATKAANPSKKRGWSDAEQAAHNDSERDAQAARGIDQNAAPAGGFVHRSHNPSVYGGGETNAVYDASGARIGSAGTSSGQKELARYRSLAEAAADRQAYQVDFSGAQADRANNLAAREHQVEAGKLQHQAALGNAPSRAAIMGGQVGGQSLEQTLAAGAGGRGLAAAAAQSQAQRGMGAGQLQGTGRAVGMRAGELGQARDTYAQGMTGIRAGDYGSMAMSQQQAEAQAQSENAQRRLNQAGQMGYEQAGLNVEQAELDARMRGAAALNQANATAVAASDARKARAEKAGWAGVSAIGSVAGAASDERTKRNVSSFSDAQAKREAYALGRAHQWEQAKTGKPVEWAHERPAEIVDDQREGMSGFRGYKKPAGGKAAAGTAERATPPEPAPEERSALLAPSDAVYSAFEKYVAPTVDRAAQASLRVLPQTSIEKMFAPSDEKTKTRIAPARADAAGRADPMTDALAEGLTPYSFEYKPGFAEAEGQQIGEKNVGIMAQNAERNAVTGVIVEKDENGMRRINMKKSTSLALAAAGHNAQKLRELEARMNAKGGR